MPLDRSSHPKATAGGCRRVVSGECEAVGVVRAFHSALGAVVLSAVAFVAIGCSDSADADESAVCRAVQDLVDALNDADAPAAVAAVERVSAAGRRTNNGTLSSRAVALAEVSNNGDDQPLENVNEELVSVADTCGDVGRPIRGLS